MLDGNNLSSDGLVIRDFAADCIPMKSGSENNTIAGNDIGRPAATGGDAGASEANTGAGTVIQGNYIVVGSDGTTAIGHDTNGVRITTESGYMIGGTAAGAGNVIAYSGADNVMIQNSSANGTASTTAQIEFFAPDVAAGGNGEGKTYLDQQYAWHRDGFPRAT